jgi:hypothetical protein
MGMELRRDWDIGIQLPAEDGAARTLPHPAPVAKTSRASKLLVVALAATITLCWMAFLCSVIVGFARSLF